MNHGYCMNHSQTKKKRLVRLHKLTKKRQQVTSKKNLANAGKRKKKNICQIRTIHTSQTQKLKTHIAQTAILIKKYLRFVAKVEAPAIRVLCVYPVVKTRAALFIL